MHIWEPELLAGMRQTSFLLNSAVPRDSFNSGADFQELAKAGKEKSPKTAH